MNRDRTRNLLVIAAGFTLNDHDLICIRYTRLHVLNSMHEHDLIIRIMHDYTHI